jgi:uncharacterized RDD family membrane protein YckC
VAITVLKNNVPWGPFTRAQIQDGLKRGDFTLQYLAHGPGLKEWLPLGEVLHYLDINEGPRTPALPPVPESRELPPVPGTVVSTPTPKPAPLHPVSPVRRPPVLPRVEKQEVKLEPPLEPQLEAKPDPRPGREVLMVPASFFPRAIAFLIDGAILFVPLGILFGLGALTIEIPRMWQHPNPEVLAQSWALLQQHIRELTSIVIIGFGWIYGAGLESSRSQATIGKRWMGVKVTDAHGERISFVRATGRYAGKYLSALPCFLGFILALFSSEGRALHDRLAETRVVRK